jgi:ABC-2 type transport system ATP-binding protein
MLRQRATQGCLVLFSSHQLDLVQDLCEDIVMVDHGRTVLAGRVSDLREASGQRRLRVQVETHDRGWLAGLDGVQVVSDHADDLRLAVPRGVDPLAVLDAARSAGRVRDFGLELPTLSELFLAAVATEPLLEEVGR